MKNLIWFPILFLLLACGNDDASDTDGGNGNRSICIDAPIEFSIEVDGINMITDSCWLFYLIDPADDMLFLDEKPAVISWRYPGYPEWDSANSFSFRYTEESIASDMSYQASNITGVVEFDGTDGKMFTALGDGAVSIHVEEFDEENNYICGTFQGNALFADQRLVDLTGSFKGNLNP